MKYTTSNKLRPPPHIYGDAWERTTDPWHKSAFPEHLAHAAPNQSDERRGGWSAVDNWGNEIGFVADGTEVEATPQQIREMKQDMQDALMRAGADTAVSLGIYDQAAKGGGE